MKPVTELALFGGNPLFDHTLHVGLPNLGNKDHFFARMEKIWQKKWLTNNGDNVKEFESKIAKYLGVRNCIAMCNATTALEIAIRGLGMKGEVIVPSFTFVATAHSLQWQEITPVFCDIDSKTHTIEPESIERLVTPLTSGIVGVHLWGKPCAIEIIRDIANRHNLKLLFDAAHAFGVSYKSTMIGQFGDAEVFSFHATKFLNSFEGGAVVTNDDGLAKKLRLMKNFGFTGMDSVNYLGINGKMSEASAAMGLTSLESIEEFIDNNYSNYLCYQKNLKGILGCKILVFDEQEKNNYQYIVVEINEEDFGLSRDQLMNILHAENIRVRRYFYPGCHQMEPYRSYYPNAYLLLPKTESITTKVLCFPNGNGVNGDEIEKICTLVRMVSKSADLITKLILENKT